MARRGRMPVILTIHGGQQALADVLMGLVERNLRSIREGAVPVATAIPARVKLRGVPMWRDAVSALSDGVMSRGTLAAWQAASLQAQDKPARIGFVSGIPEVVWGTGQLACSLPRTQGGPGVSGLYAPQSGKVEERMLLTLDDDMARPVREINDAIARHNAKQIRQHSLPRLYTKKADGSPLIRYETEGSPELWWDAKQIFDMKHDDCEGLAAYRAGELLNDGLQANVWTRFIASPNGRSRLFHAITRVEDPTTGKVGFDDPSVRLGMPVPPWYKQFCTQQRAAGREL